MSGSRIWYQELESLKVKSGVFISLSLSLSINCVIILHWQLAIREQLLNYCAVNHLTDNIQ